MGYINSLIGHPLALSIWIFVHVLYHPVSSQNSTDIMPYPTRGRNLISKVSVKKDPPRSSNNILVEGNVSSA